MHKINNMENNKMTAVEWLWKALLDSGFKELENVEGFYYQAKEMEKEINRKMYEHAMFALVDGNGHGETFDEYWNRTFKN